MAKIYPTFRYRDAAAAIDFLERAFGFESHAVHEDDTGTIMHAELKLGDGMIMLGTVREDTYGKVAPPPGSGAIYVATDDTDALHARARDAGAEIVREPFDTDYRSHDFTARDPEGNVWHFGTYAP